MPDIVTTGGRRRHSGSGNGLGAQYARAIGVTTGTAEQLLYGNDALRTRVIKWIQTCRANAADAVLDRWMHELLTAYFERPPRPYGPELLRAVAKADAAEQEAQVEFLLGEDTIADFLRKLDSEIALKVSLRDALVHLKKSRRPA